MTNKQNDENINELFEDSGNASSNIAFDDECIRLQGERQPVKNDAKTIDIYEHVANKLGRRAVNVERTIRHCVTKADRESEAWKKYIGTKKANNTTFLFVLAMKMED